MDFTKVEKMFNVNLVVDQAEKSVASALSFVPNSEVKETLLSLNAANANFARANLDAAKSFGEVAKTLVADAQKSFKTAVNA